MDEREDPRSRFRPLGTERGRAPPNGEEPLLHRVFREPVVPEHANREAVRDPADAVVELSQRALVATCHERYQRFVGEMSMALAHGPARLGRKR